MTKNCHQSPTNHRQGGTDIDLLHISGLSAEGLSSVIILILIALTLGGVAFIGFYLYGFLRDQCK